MSITKETNIGQLVALDYRAASIFKKNGIDFCCNGNRSIAEACSQKDISADELISNLTAATNATADTGIDFKSWPLDLLADYIEKKHHRYVEAKVLEITPYLAKIARVHGDRHPELHEVEAMFLESAEQLTLHMKKEELMLFPAVRKMVQTNTKFEAPFGSVANPISAMMSEHDTEGERFRLISKLTNDYQVPEDGCNTYRVTLALLKEFEDDLHMHIHLENNILFPKAIALEKQLS